MSLGRRAGSGALLRVLAVAVLTCAAAPEASLSSELGFQYRGSTQLLVSRRSDPFLMRKHLYPALKEAGIRRIELVAGAESIVQERSPSGMMYLDGLPAPALQALMLVLQPETAGTELDLLVEGRGAPDDPDRLWSVRRDRSGNVLVLKGVPPAVAQGPGPSSEELSERFGIGALEDGDARWSGDQRRIVGLALELLTPAELERVRGVRFVRAKREKGGHAGTYGGGRSGEPGRITVFDLAFEPLEGRTRYVGSSELAVPYGTYLILHEIGHAIADAERREMRMRRSRHADAYDRLSETYYAYLDEYKRSNLHRSPDEAVLERRRWLEQEMPRLYAELKTLVEAMQRIDLELEQQRSLSAIERRYAELPGATRGPTEYALKSAEESFAEAFALYHVDAESLRWIAADSHEWFASGAHLAITDAELPAVAAPSSAEPSASEAAPAQP